MSYKVLARKWRPQHFRDMIGQEPVLRALVNALDTNRLHHAYLFTGMRGVGKTTIARIFAKCLNCETNGVSASPCGECSACQDIEAGRFFDLIEVDAASRTKVDETRELLENVPYAPASGRYKVYLIDEVHMFSNHSFNALLKTLEEPPEHVKFLLATTDPQKVPVTVLSRCLQFNLKRMSPSILTDYLAKILGEESIDHEKPALDLIARASEGSVRDALSLVEQAAAFGEGAVRELDVESMLGRASVDRLLGLIESLGKSDMPELFERIEQLAEYAPDFAELMGELLSLIHRIAMLQTVPNSVMDNAPGYDRLTQLAETLAPDEVQLFYQIGLHARRDMPFAPDPREAFDMALLRMNAFKPQADSGVAVAQQTSASGSVGGVGSAAAATVGGRSSTGDAAPSHTKSDKASAGSGAHNTANQQRSDTAAPTLPVRGEVSAGGALRAAALAAARGEPPPIDASGQAGQAAGRERNVHVGGSPAATESPDPAVPARHKPPLAEAKESAAAHASTGSSAKASSSDRASVDKASAIDASSASSDRPVTAQSTRSSPIDKTSITPSDWHSIVAELDISGMPRQLASNSVLQSIEPGHLRLLLESSSEHLNTARFSERVQSAFSSWKGEDTKLSIELVDSELETPARLDELHRNNQMAAAKESIDKDPVVQQLIDRVDASVDEASIQPLGQT